MARKQHGDHVASVDDPALATRIRNLESMLGVAPSPPAKAPAAPQTPATPPPQQRPAPSPPSGSPPPSGDGGGWRWSASQEVFNAIQRKVDAQGARAVFDSIDGNQSGRVSADELAKALQTMQVTIDDAQAEDVIRAVNERVGSKRKKALSFDIFCQVFRPGTTHGGNVVQSL